MFKIEMYNNDHVKMYSYIEILKHLEISMKYNLPFSFLRFGDGGIKYIHSIIYQDYEQLDNILFKEGIPSDKSRWLLNKWAQCAREADYIDSPEIYFTDKFWPRVRMNHEGNIRQMTEKTIFRLKMWKILYDHCNFTNEHYINPEMNYLLCTRLTDKWTLLDLLENKRICIIGIFPEIKEKLEKYNIDTIQIVSHFENQYENSFNNTINTIEKTVNKYDLWIVCAGELGRVYSGFIKSLGGRSIDMGFVLEYWMNGEVPIRLKPFLMKNPDNPLEFILTDEGKKYQEWL